MGWTFSQPTKELLVQDILTTQENEVGKWEIIDHSLRGNNLWTVLERTRKNDGMSYKIIVLFLLQGGRGSKYDRLRWGYKDISEDMQPYHYGCPQRLIDKCGPPINEQAAKWRALNAAAAKERAAKQKKRREMNKRLEPGAVVLCNTVYGKWYLKIASRSTFGRRSLCGNQLFFGSDGKVDDQLLEGHGYKVHRKLIADVMTVKEAERRMRAEEAENPGTHSV